MSSSKNYYEKLGIVRLLSCFAILLYHMNLLKGGYLAVCTFFVLSGYLTSISCFKNENFSIKRYYLNKIKKLYIPLLIVVFSTITVVSFLQNIIWLNLKPETTSILLGYNNYWQLGANLDYFARHVSSPFMHFWYMGIIIQFDLIFPYVYIILKKIGSKLGSFLPCLFVNLIAILSSIYFVDASLDGHTMHVYYSTFTRVFSLLFGVALGFMHVYNGSLLPNFLKQKYIINFLFYFYLIIMVYMFIYIDSSYEYYGIAMILTSFITTRLIEYGTLYQKSKLTLFDRIIKNFSNISYEIYLVQYPIIYLFQELKILTEYRDIVILFLTLTISCILNFVTNYKIKNIKINIIRKIVLFIVILVCLYGGYQYLISVDHTNEMKELENKLLINEQIMEEKQKIYIENIEKQNKEWSDKIKNLENLEKELPEMITNLSVVGVGDSVMLGAIDNLYQIFPNGYFDAKISRTAWVLNEILKELENKKLLSENIIISLGSNGDCTESCKRQIMETIGSRNVFWINTNNDDVINYNLNKFSQKFDNLNIIDWKTISYNHPEYFVSDKIHLTESGKKVFSKMIYDELYEFYLNKYNKQKSEMMNSYEKEIKNRISFIGNDMLLNAYDFLKEDYSDSEFIINSNFDYELLIKEINERKNLDKLSHKLVFIFDKSLNLSDIEYMNILSLCEEHEIYVLDIEQKLELINSSNVKIMGFDLKDEYLMPDKLHLNSDGNLSLKAIINQYVTVNIEK